MVTLSIIGTGDFARAMGHRLLEHGYKLVYGSRLPKKRDLTAIDEVFKTNTVVTTIEKAIDASDIILLCVHSNAHASLKPIAEFFADKSVVDVSNVPGKVDKASSNAEKLAGILPKAFVVKAFNTLSTYKLTNTSSGEGSVVYVASDHQESREKVLQIARTCGYIGIDSGSLSSARQLEDMPLKLCGDWLIPLIITVLTFTFWVIWVAWQDDITWTTLFATTVNEILGHQAITLLGLTYLPGGLAGFAQVINGTKYKRFPSWLDKWLKARKQLGLLALVVTCMHMVMALALMSSRRYADLYQDEGTLVPANRTQDIFIYYDTELNLKGELLVLTGVIATTLMSILGITSVPTIGSLLTWRQWIFVQSYMGFVMFCFAEGHIMVKAVPMWTRMTFTQVISSKFFVSSFIPWVALLLRIILWSPGVSCYVSRIRAGWERVAVDPEKGKAGRRTKVAPQEAKHGDKEKTENTAIENSVNGQVSIVISKEK